MSPFLERLPILVIEPHGRCNCRCLMCDIWKVTDAAEITAAELERHLADIDRLGVEWAVFTGGEPLMHSDLFRLSRMLRERGIRTTILSSGLLLSRHAAQITVDVDDVIVSAGRSGSGSQCDPRRAARLRTPRRRGSRHSARIAPTMPVSARCTVQARNAAHLRETVAAARALGLRSISFLAADLTSQAFHRPIPWPAARQAGIAPALATLEAEIERLIAEAVDGFVVESPAKLRRIAAHFRAHLGLEPHTAPRCNAPWVSAVLETDGNVRPCFFHPPIGNTSEGTLLEVLNSARAVAFRETLSIADDPTCRRCVCSLYRPTA